MERLFRSGQVNSSCVFGFSCAAFAIVGGLTVSVHAELVMENILFSEQVNRSGSPPNSKTTFFEFPPSPNAIAFSQTAMIAPSFATGSYDIQWSGDSATIDVSVSHSLAGFDGSTSSTSNIRFRPAVDSLFTVNAFFNYAHPPTLLGSVNFLVVLRMNPPGPAVFSAGDTAGTHWLEPPSGTIPASGSFELLAGNLYQISHIVTTRNYAAPPPGAEWLGNGEIHITIAPVPEPATAAMLVLGALMIRRMNAAARIRSPRCQS